MFGKKTFKCKKCGKQVDQDSSDPPVCHRKPMIRQWTTNFIVRTSEWGNREPHNQNEFR